MPCTTRVALIIHVNFLTNTVLSLGNGADRKKRELDYTELTARDDNGVNQTVND